MGLYQVAEIRWIPRAQSFIIVISASDHLPLRTIKCCSVVFGVTLRLLVIHSVVSRQKKQLRRSTAINVINSLVRTVYHSFALTAISAYPSCIQRPS